MNEQMKNDYEKLIRFWNQAFERSAKENNADGFDPETDWKSLAPSEKLLNAAYALGGKKRVLDYGCGSGWAGIAAAKGGCANVICADTASFAIETARLYARLTRTETRIDFECIRPDWLSTLPDGGFDGMVCSNVLDVIPEEAAEEIVRQARRVLKPEGEAVIGLNFYMNPAENPERHLTVKNDRYIYIDDTLRLVSRTDEEWTRLFERYFTVISLEHFAWPGEKTETRRLFRLKKNA